jgi:hypothetical protein
MAQADGYAGDAATCLQDQVGVVVVVLEEEGEEVMVAVTRVVAASAFCRCLLFVDGSARP